MWNLLRTHDRGKTQSNRSSLESTILTNRTGGWFGRALVTGKRHDESPGEPPEATVQQ
ncbi:MAG: hypothetical protein ABIK07_01685 [Planctomycetota bacterium]